jgi:hypothetical protein
MKAALPFWSSTASEFLLRELRHEHGVRRLRPHMRLDCLTPFELCRGESKGTAPEGVEL